MKRPRNINLDDDLYAALEQLALQVSLNEGRRVSVSELIRRACDEQYGHVFVKPMPLRAAESAEKYSAAP